MPRRGPRYNEEEARAAIAAALSWSEAMRLLGMCHSGNGRRILQRYAREVWHIPTDHFDPNAARARGLGRPARPLAEILVKGSVYQRARLKERLYAAGLKHPICELCGQGEIWRGQRISLILDHTNGVSNDNRLENLRIVCPNCAATLETHCGRNAKRPAAPEQCAYCGTEFRPKSWRQRFCSQACGVHAPNIKRSFPERRKVDRPPYTQLLREVNAMGWSAVGRRYGVSDNAVRKWVRAYEAEMARERARGDEDVAA